MHKNNQKVIAVAHGLSGAVENYLLLRPKWTHYCSAGGSWGVTLYPARWQLHDNVFFSRTL